jgi:hypothetical protein
VLEEFQRRANTSLRGRSDNFALVFAQALSDDRHPLHRLATEVDNVRRAWLAHVQRVFALQQAGVLTKKDTDTLRRGFMSSFYRYVRPLDEAVHRFV